jgi:hypothetical protein
MSVIDPTCGSGHFLLGVFHRLVDRWRQREPDTGVEVLVERALGQVTGVDVNAFAVAIARFRLLVAALKACGRISLERAPAFATRVATGDSLLPWGDPGLRGEQATLDEEPRSIIAVRACRRRTRACLLDRSHWPGGAGRDLPP